MSGICIDKLPHSCGTRQGLQVFADAETGKVNGFCFSCRKWVANPYGKEVTVDEVELPEPKTEAEIEAEIAEVDAFQVMDIPSRKLRGKYLDKFGVKISVSEADGKTPTAMYFPIHKKGKLSGYYIKTLDEKKYTWSIGDVRGGEPFGWQRAKGSGAYKLIIVEGKEDAVAVEAIFDREGDEAYHPAVIALPNGVNSVKSSLVQIADYANKNFKEIVICFDDDIPGKEATEEAMLIFPNAVTAVLPEKDPNECLVKGKVKAAYKALAFNTHKPKNTRLIRANKDLHMIAREPTQPGELTWCFPTLQKLMRGVRLGETVYEGAGVKMGKSELLNMQAAHHIKVDGVPVMVAKPEEETKKTYKLMANKMVGGVFHDPDVEFDYEAFDKAGKMLEDKLYMVDLYQHMGWDTLKTDIIHAANEGVKAVFIDPITNLTAGMNAADANTFLTGFAREISAISKDKKIVTFLFCHLKAPEGNISYDQRQKKYNEQIYHGLGNCPHEKGGSVESAQFAGSRAMMQSANLMLGLEGNKDDDLPQHIRNMRWLKILEDREFGNSATIPLYWNDKTTLFNEA